MTILIRAFLAGALLLASLAPAGAQFIPNGSFRQSCVNIRMEGPNLVALCTAPNGQHIRSSIIPRSCGGGDIANMNGYLRCNGGGFAPGGPGPGFGGGLPYGSYQQSCRNIRMHPGGRLSASCTAPNGQLVHSNLFVANCRRGADIANMNGRLQCLYR